MESRTLATIGNYNFNDTNWVLSEFVGGLFMMSSRILDAFKLDLDQFMMGCFLGLNQKNCSDKFGFFPEPYHSCYEGQIDPGALGSLSSISIFLFFEPNLKLGKYSSAPGAYVTVVHPEGYSDYQDGVFIGPGDHVTISTNTVEKIQTENFKNIKCANRYGMETYDFTGVPFEVAYSRQTCARMCYAEIYYKICNCAPLFGVNLTNSECLEKRKNRDCILGFASKNMTRIVPLIRHCTSKCLPQCNVKKFELTEQRKRNYFNNETVRILLEKILFLNNRSTLTESLLRELSSRVEEISANIGQVKGCYICNLTDIKWKRNRGIKFDLCVCVGGGWLFV